MDLAGRILYEDNHLIAINKEPGELVQGDKSGDTTLAHMVKEHLRQVYKKPGNVYLGVTHRLDRPTSGVVLYAKTEKALRRINELFRTDAIQKVYWAVVDKVPETVEGRLEHYLLKDPKTNKSRSVAKTRNGAKLATLDYRLLSASRNYYLLEVHLHSGRHHQIRAQFEAIGLSIKGDLKYGSRRSNPDGGICLHARSLSFIHPVRQESITITAPIPTDGVWQAFLNQQ
jgi:23S rRNA pseudouridine1911/1915/1917 synthase